MADLQIYDDGKGLKIVASPVNKAGNPIPLPTGESLSWTPSDPTAFQLVPDPSDATGLTQDVQPPSGGAFKDGTGYTATLTGTDANGNQVSNPCPPFDIIADGLGGFTFAETAL